MNSPPVRNLLNAGMLEGFICAGMRPAHQARSRELVIRLFNEGLNLLNDVDFDGLSIETLCQRTGSTVGAFYSRFENKDAFINALQRIVVTGARREIYANYENASWETLDQLVGSIAKGALLWYRRHEGLVRASLRRANGERDMWTPLRELGELNISCAVPRILAFLPPQAHESAVDRIRLAFQMLFGALNNIVQVNPGPFTLEDRRTAPLIAEAMTGFIRAADRRPVSPDRPVA